MSAAPDAWLPACTEAMEEMLETMFFETLVDRPSLEQDVPSNAIWVSVDFQGAVSGRVSVAVSPPVAGHLLVNFLGREEDEPASAAEQVMVTSELANVLCGCMLSRVDPENRLEIAAPQWSEGAVPAVPCIAFPLENGNIFVTLEA